MLVIMYAPALLEHFPHASVITLHRNFWRNELGAETPHGSRFFHLTHSLGHRRTIRAAMTDLSRWNIGDVIVCRHTEN